MPGDASVWIVAIIAIAFVLVVALWFGRGLIFKKSGDEVSLELKSDSADDAASGSKVEVLGGAKITGSSVGDITGVRGGAGSADVDVLKDGKISDADVGNITGVSSPGKTDSD